MPADYPYLLTLLYQVPGILVFALLLAATLVAARRARGHVAWLALTTAARGLGILSAIINVFLLQAARTSGMHSQPTTLLLVGEQILGAIGSLCAIAGGVLLLLRLLGPQEPGRY